MNHPAELKVHKFIQDVMAGEATVSADVQERILADVKEALAKQFKEGARQRDFTLRMSNIGRPYCQLWFAKNKPELDKPTNPNFLMNMILGDLVEAVFKGMLTAAGVEFSDGEGVSMQVGKHTIHGTPDLVTNGRVDDVKSASPYSYQHKFADFETLSRGDAFGYVAQLAGYAEAMGVEPGGWWVVNKATGEFKYVDADGLREPKRHEAELKSVETKADDLEKNVFFRCYTDEEELFRRKPTGNRKLTNACSWCDFKRECWPNAVERPSIPSSAKEPPMVWYTHIENEDTSAEA